MHIDVFAFHWLEAFEAEYYLRMHSKYVVLFPHGFMNSPAALSKK